MNAEGVQRAVQRIAHEVLERARAEGSLEGLALLALLFNAAEASRSPSESGPRSDGPAA